MISVAPSNRFSSAISADRLMFLLSLSSSISVIVAGSTVLRPALPLITMGRSSSMLSSLMGMKVRVSVAFFSPAKIMRVVSPMKKRVLSPSEERLKSTYVSASTAVSSVTSTVTSTSISPASSRILAGFSDSFRSACTICWALISSSSSESSVTSVELSVTAGPDTSATSPLDRARLSAVHTALAAAQSAVGGREMDTSTSESGSMAISQPMLLPCCKRRARVTVPPVTSNTSSRMFTKLISTSSLKCTSNVNSLPSCDSGIDSKRAVSVCAEASPTHPNAKPAANSQGTQARRCSKNFVCPITLPPQESVFYVK